MNHPSTFILHILHTESFVTFVVSKYFDLTNLPITRGIMLQDKSFYNATSQSLFGCYSLCSKYTACSSINFLKESLMCQLNLMKKDAFPDNIVKEDNTYYINKGDLDTILPSPCNYSLCAANAMCVKTRSGLERCLNPRSCVYDSPPPLVLRQMSGFILSKNYPLSYPKNFIQKYVVHGPIGTIIELKFVTFLTERNYDKLTVRRGCNLSSPIVGIYSGSSYPSRLRINLNYAWIHFLSDYSVTEKGFKIEYIMRCLYC